MILCILATFTVRQIPVLLKVVVYPKSADHIPTFMAHLEHICLWTSVLLIWMVNTMAQSIVDRSKGWLALYRPIGQKAKRKLAHTENCQKGSKEFLPTH